MKKRYTDFIKDKQILSYIVPFIIILVIFIVFISSSLAALTPIESIVITSENSSYENKEQGSWQITKKANWLTKGKVKLTFDINTMSKTKAKNVDLLLVVNTSNTLSSEDFNEMKTYVNEFANNILKEGSPSRMSLINFNSSSQIVSDFTNDKTQITDSINNMQMGEGTSFYKALQSTDEILKSYQPVSGNNLVIIFLTSSLPNKDMPNEEWQYNYLKSEYPNLTINSISYEMGSNISDKIKNISDKQFAATKQTLINTLYNATDMRNIYDEFIITDYIDDTNFQIENLDSLKNDIGKVKIEYEGTTPKVIIDLSNELISGESTKISFVIDLKDDKLESGGIFSVNKSIGVTSAILENTENILSTKTPVVADNYKVSYDSNLPSGCTVEEAIPSTKRYSVFDVVRISNDISCPNYQFKGWDIVSDKKVTMVNDNNFLMPSSDIILKATWSKVSLNMSMDGQVYEPQTLNNIIEKQAVLDNEASEFVTATTGIDFANISSNTNGKGVYTMASTKDDAFPIHYYRGAVTNNNVKFANFCWKIVRTTETGGVKLIYNGVPNSTTGACSNTTGTLTQTGTSAFNDKSSALTDVGYMQGKRYESVSKQMDNYTWEGINGKTSESRNLDWYSSVKTLEQSAANLWIGGSNLFAQHIINIIFLKQ